MTMTAEDLFLHKVFSEHKSNLLRIGEGRCTITLKQKNVNNEEIMERTVSILEDAGNKSEDNDPVVFLNRNFETLSSETDGSAPSMRVVVGESSRTVLQQDNPVESDEYSKNVDLVEEQGTIMQSNQMDLRAQLNRNKSHNSIIAQDFSPTQTVMMTPGFNNGKLSGQHEVMHHGGVRSRWEQFDHEHSRKEMVSAQDMNTRSRTRSRSRLRVRGSSKGFDKTRLGIIQSKGGFDKRRLGKIQSKGGFDKRRLGKIQSKGGFDKRRLGKIQSKGGFDKSRLGVRQGNRGESQN